MTVPPTISEALIRAYHATTYRADLPGGAVHIRIGSKHPQLDAWLTTAGYTHWAFITASNPASQAYSAPINLQRHDALIEALTDGGYRFFSGSGVQADTDWEAEQSVFVAGLDAHAARQIGRRFGQHAIVIGTREHAAQLAWCIGGTLP